MFDMEEIGREWNQFSSQVRSFIFEEFYPNQRRGRRRRRETPSTSELEVLVEHERSMSREGREMFSLLRSSEEYRMKISTSIGDLFNLILRPSNEEYQMKRRQRIPRRFFEENELFDRWMYSMGEEKVYIRCRKGIFDRDEFIIGHSLDSDWEDSSSNEERFSSRFSVKKRSLTIFDQVSFALPIFSLSKINDASQIFLRCSSSAFLNRQLPVLITDFEDRSYAIFSLSNDEKILSSRSFSFELIQSSPS